MPTPIRFKGIVGTTAQIATDRFAGRIAFDSTLNRFVMFYDATNYATMARRDVLETFAAGINDSTLTAGRVMYAGTSGRHSGSAKLTVLTAGVANLLIGDGVVAETSALTLDAPAGNDAVLSFRSANVSRWGVGRMATSLDFAIIARNSSGVETDRPVTIPNTAAAAIAFSRTLNTTGNIQTSGVTRISSGGAGSFTTLSTTGLATLAQATVSDIAADRIVTTTTAGRLTGDAGLTRTALSGVTRLLFVGDNAVAGNAAFIARRTSGFFSGFLYQDSGSATRWSHTYDNSFDWILSAYTSGAALIDNPLSIVNASAGLITLGGSTLRPVNFTGAIQTTGVQRISAAGAATFTTLSTTGLATLAQATVSDLTTGRMVSTTTGGRLQALDAAGSRALIDAPKRPQQMDATTGETTYTVAGSGSRDIGTALTVAGGALVVGKEYRLRLVISTTGAFTISVYGGSSSSGLSLGTTAGGTSSVSSLECALLCTAIGASATFNFAGCRTSRSSGGVVDAYPAGLAAPATFSSLASFDIKWQILNSTGGSLNATVFHASIQEMN